MTATPEKIWRELAPRIASHPTEFVSVDGGKNFLRARKLSTVARPVRPVAVRTYDDEGMTGCLVADFDATRGGSAQATADAAALEQLLARLGLRAFADLSPSGGRHVYVPLAPRRPLRDVVIVMRALAARFPSLDIQPMMGGRRACIAPPAASWKRGGMRTLTTPFQVAQRAVLAPNGAAGWHALLEELRPQIVARQTENAERQRAHRAAIVPAAAAHPGLLLPAQWEQMARTGDYDGTRYRGPSEARMALLRVAYERGLTLGDVEQRLESGAWPGLWHLLGGSRRRSSDGRLKVLREFDWAKVTTTGAPRSAAPNSYTRSPEHRGGQPATDRQPPDQPEFVARWWAAVRLAEPQRYDTRAGLSHRAVLRACGRLAIGTRTRYLRWGVRSIGFQANLHHTTVAACLRELRDEHDPFLDVLQLDRGLGRPDVYALRIPTTLLEASQTMTWRPGRVGLHRAFRVLGNQPAFVHEALVEAAGEPRTVRELTAAAVLPETSVRRALKVLGEHGLAQHASASSAWALGPADLDVVATRVGADEVSQQLLEEIRAERRDFHERIAPYLEARDAESAEHLYTTWAEADDAAFAAWREVPAPREPEQLAFVDRALAGR